MKLYLWKWIRWGESDFGKLILTWTNGFLCTRKWGLLENILMEVFYSIVGIAMSSFIAWRRICNNILLGEERLLKCRICLGENIYCYHHCWVFVSWVIWCEMSECCEVTGQKSEIWCTLTHLSSPVQYTCDKLTQRQPGLYILICMDDSCGQLCFHSGLSEDMFMWKKCFVQTNKRKYFPNKHIKIRGWVIAQW